jgi:hypothetical protein
LLHLLFDVATRGLLALGIALADWIVLVALAIVIRPVSGASSRGATDLRSVTMALRSRGHIPSGGHWMLPIELHERVLGYILQPLYLGIRW